MFTRWMRERLIALQDSNCTTVGGEFDFREPQTDGAEESFGETGSQVLDAVGVGLEISGGAIVHGAQGSLCFQVKGIVAGETDFDEALAALHGIEAGTDKIAVEENVSGGGKKVDVGQAGLEDLGVAADGAEFQLSSALSADEGAAGGLDDDVAGNFLEVDIAGDAFELHITHDLLDVDEAGLGGELKLSLFGDGELEIGFEFLGLSGRVENGGGDFDTISGLLKVHVNLAGSASATHHNLKIFRGLYLDTAIGHVMNANHRTALDGEMLLKMLAGSDSRGGPKEQSGTEHGNELLH